MLKNILRYLGITVSAVTYAVGIALFLNPNHLAPGGISGIAIIIDSLLPFSVGVGTLILIFNIPIMIAGAWKFGLRFLFSSIYAVILSSLAIDYLPKITGVAAVTTDQMLSAVIGGALLGASMGIMFRLNSTTGGIDIIVKILRQYFPYLKSGQLAFMMDAVVVALSVLAFGEIEVGLFAGIAIFISSHVLNKTLYGFDEATLLYIVSRQRELLEEKILNDLEIGATMLKARGAYSKDEMEVILCVIRRQNLPKIRNLIRKYDAKAFVIVSSAQQVFGEGFQDQYKPEI